MILCSVVQKTLLDAEREAFVNKNRVEGKSENPDKVILDQIVAVDDKISNEIAVDWKREMFSLPDLPPSILYLRT